MRKAWKIEFDLNGKTTTSMWHHRTPKKYAVMRTYDNGEWSIYDFSDTVGSAKSKAKRQATRIGERQWFYQNGYSQTQHAVLEKVYVSEITILETLEVPDYQEVQEVRQKIESVNQVKDLLTARQDLSETTATALTALLNDLLQEQEVIKAKTGY